MKRRRDVFGHKCNCRGFGVVTTKVHYGQAEDLAKNRSEVPLANGTHLDEDVMQPFSRLALNDPRLARLGLVDESVLHEKIHHLALVTEFEEWRRGHGDLSIRNGHVAPTPGPCRTPVVLSRLRRIAVSGGPICRWDRTAVGDGDVNVLALVLPAELHGQSKRWLGTASVPQPGQKRSAPSIRPLLRSSFMDVLPTFLRWFR